MLLQKLITFFLMRHDSAFKSTVFFCFLGFLHTGKTDRGSDFSVVCCILTSEVRKKRKKFGFNGIIIGADGIRGDHK